MEEAACFTSSDLSVCAFKDTYFYVKENADLYHLLLSPMNATADVFL